MFPQVHGLGPNCDHLSNFIRREIPFRTNGQPSLPLVDLPLLPIHAFWQSLHLRNAMCNRSMTLPKGFCMAKKDAQFHSLLQRWFPQPLALLCGGHQHFFPTLVLVDPTLASRRPDRPNGLHPELCGLFQEPFETVVALGGGDHQHQSLGPFSLLDIKSFHAHRRLSLAHIQQFSDR